MTHLFQTPLALLLFLPLVFAAWRLFRHGRRRGVPFAPFRNLPQRRTLRQRLAVVPPCLLVAGLAAAIVAAARPQAVLSNSRVSRDSIAIAMAADLSGSMMALDLSDFAPDGSLLVRRTRLDAVKDAFAKFIGKRPDDLVALVTFGGFAVTRSPLTLDHEALVGLLDSLRIDPQDPNAMPEEYMTAVGDGLALACARLESATNVASRIVVLLSDGVSNAGAVKPAEATALAKRLGYKVYTIGVGATSGRVPFLGMRGGKAVVMPGYVEFDEAELRRIAKETGGRYFNARSADALERTMKEIDALEKTRVEEVVYENRRELFVPWLLSGLGLVVAALALGIVLERRLA